MAAARTSPRSVNLEMIAQSGTRLILLWHFQLCNLWLQHESNYPLKEHEFDYSGSIESLQMAHDVATWLYVRTIPLIAG
jgi:hypothetical protein